MIAKNVYLNDDTTEVKVEKTVAYYSNLFRLRDYFKVWVEIKDGKWVVHCSYRYLRAGSRTTAKYSHVVK